jgi:ribonuclease HII
MAGGWSALERSFRDAGAKAIAGVDEVGRGPLAGPVVVCAIVMPFDRRAIAGVDDSKKLDAPARERLAAQIREQALALALAAAPVSEIARHNIYQATARAMGRALDRLAGALGHEPDEILVDGKPIKTLGRPHHAIVKGDGRCYSIACASIVAKVLRDRLMANLHARHGAYGWDSNAGYGTPAHIEGLRRAGLTAHHRVSFCRSALGGQLEL